MKRASYLLKNTLMLTAVSLLLRSASLFFQTRLTAIIGAEGVGLFQMIISVQALAVTLATSGIRFCTTRLLSEELGAQRPGSVGGVMLRCFSYSLFFGLLSALALFLLSDKIGVWTGDPRISRSLRFFAPSLPFVALSAVIGGYFVACLRPWKSSVVQVFEQLFFLALILFILPLLYRLGISQTCAAVCACLTTSNFVSFALAFVLYRFDRGLSRERKTPCRGTIKRILKISLPLAFSSYARTILSTFQHLMVPPALRRSGASASQALASYGTVHGMALPVLAFPQALFIALAELLVPELTSAQVRGDMKKAEKLAGKILSFTLVFSSVIALFFFIFGKKLGDMLYRGENAGHYIRLMAPLVIVMYADTVTDGILKGLGLQLHAMVINIADALLCLIFVPTLLPLYAVNAYVAMIVLSECFNFALSFHCLSKNLNIRLFPSLFCKKRKSGSRLPPLG